MLATDSNIFKTSPNKAHLEATFRPRVAVLQLLLQCPPINISISFVVYRANITKVELSLQVLREKVSQPCMENQYYFQWQ